MNLPTYEWLDDVISYQLRFKDKRRRILRIICSRTILNPTFSANIEAVFKISGPAVRDIVSKARLVGVPIASTSNGYWLAANEAELVDTKAHLDGRIMKIQMVRDALDYPVWPEGQAVEQIEMSL